MRNGSKIKVGDWVRHSDIKVNGGATMPVQDVRESLGVMEVKLDYFNPEQVLKTGWFAAADCTVTNPQ